MHAGPGLACDRAHLHQRKPPRPVHRPTRGAL